MKIEARKRGPVTVLELHGKVTIGETARLREAFHQEIETGAQRFVLDLLHVPFLDSAGVGEVVGCHTRAIDHGGRVCLALNTRGHDLFTLYELNKVMRSFDNVEDAIASFVPTATTPPLRLAVGGD